VKLNLILYKKIKGFSFEKMRKGMFRIGKCLVPDSIHKKVKCLIKPMPLIKPII
jgi:hypothetical protein